MSVLDLAGMQVSVLRDDHGVVVSRALIVGQHRCRSYSVNAFMRSVHIDILTNLGYARVTDGVHSAWVEGDYRKHVIPYMDDLCYLQVVGSRFRFTSDHTPIECDRSCGRVTIA